MVLTRHQWLKEYTHLLRPRHLNIIRREDRNYADGSADYYLVSTGDETVQKVLKLGRAMDETEAKELFYNSREGRIFIR